MMSPWPCSAALMDILIADVLGSQDGTGSWISLWECGQVCVQGGEPERRFGSDRFAIIVVTRPAAVAEISSDVLK